MTRLIRHLAFLACVLALAGCAGSGGGLGIPQCAPDRGTVEAPTVNRGDTWSYGQIDDYTKIHRGVFVLETTGTTGDAIDTRTTMPGGQAVAEQYGRAWAWKSVSNRGWDWLSRLSYGSQTVGFSPPFNTIPFPLRAGQSWNDNVVAINPATQQRTAIQMNNTARCWERIKVPAGEFVALRIERRGFVQDVEWWKSQTTLTQVDWYLPEVNRVVMTWFDSTYFDYRQRPSSTLTRGDRLRWELIEYKPAK
jgi:hypothetical protein